MQLFTHLLSSYLQGMGDFFSALNKVEQANEKTVGGQVLDEMANLSLVQP